MKKFIKLSAVLMGIVLLTACNGAESGGLTPQDVAGVWQKDMGDGFKTMELRTDLTYSETITLTGDFAMETNTEDTYELKGDTIFINYSDYGMVSEYEVTLTEDTMTWDNGKTQIVYTRIE